MSEHCSTIRSGVLAVLAVITTGCAAPTPVQPIDVERRVLAAPESVQGKIEARLLEMGFDIEDQPQNATAPFEIKGSIQGHAAQSLADCKRVWVQDPFVENFGARSRPVAVQSVSAWIDVRILPDGSGSLISVQTKFLGHYINSFVNLGFDRPCRSAGVVETAIFDSAATSGS